MRDSLRSLRTTLTWTGRTVFETLGCEPSLISPEATLSEIAKWRYDNELVAIAFRRLPAADGPGTKPSDRLELLPTDGPGISIDLAQTNGAFVRQVLAELAGVRLLSADGEWK